MICLKPGQTFNYTPRSRRDLTPRPTLTLRALSAMDAMEASGRIDAAKSAAAGRAATGPDVLRAIFNELRGIVSNWTLTPEYNPAMLEHHLTLGEAQEILAVAIGGVLSEEALGN